MDRARIQAELSAKTEDITRRIESIQGEVATAGDIVKDTLKSSPIVAVGGAVAAGLLVGLVFGGSRKKSQGKTLGRHAALVNEYIEAIADDVRRTSRKGIDAAEAVRHALKDRVPVIFYTGQREPEQKQGIVGESLDLVYKTALGFAVKYAVDLVVGRINIPGLAEALEAEGGSDAAVPVAAVVSE